MSKRTRIKLLLVGEFEVNGQNPMEDARAQLDAFREAVQPAAEYGLTLYQATAGDLAGFRGDSSGLTEPDASAALASPFLVITPYLGERCTSPHASIVPNASIVIETAPRASVATRQVRQRLRRCGYDLDASVTYSAGEIAALFKTAGKVAS